MVPFGDGIAATAAAWLPYTARADNPIVKRSVFWAFDLTDTGEPPRREVGASDVKRPHPLSNHRSQ
jgi:hypothetical protein